MSFWQSGAGHESKRLMFMSGPPSFRISKYALSPDITWKLLQLGLFHKIFDAETK